MAEKEAVKKTTTARKKKAAPKTTKTATRRTKPANGAAKTVSKSSGSAAKRTSSASKNTGSAPKSTKSVEKPVGRAKVKKVMKEFKKDELHSGSKKGPKVKSRKQAIAIALSEGRKAESGKVKTQKGPVARKKAK